jgi:alkaline phosphatase
MTTNMITAARLLGHKSINGKYQSLLQLDQFPVLGHQMTHSLDSYITDSANSASALYSGHKSTVNAMGYAMSSQSRKAVANSGPVYTLIPRLIYLMIPKSRLL